MKKKNFASFVLVIMAVFLSVYIAPMAAFSVSDDDTINLEESYSDSNYFSSWSYDSNENAFSIIGDVTIKGTVKNATTTLRFNIAPHITVKWVADYSFSRANASPRNISAIDIFDGGSFEVVSGSISSDDGITIYSKSSTVIVSGGSVSSEQGVAISNNDGGPLIISGGSVSSDNGNAISNTSTTTLVSGGSTLIWGNIYGNFTIAEGAILNVPAEKPPLNTMLGRFTNYGTINNFGTINHNTVLVNKLSGTINNFGVINEGIIRNEGKINTVENGFTRRGRLINDFSVINNTGGAVEIVMQP